MILLIIITAIASLLSAYLYHAGGLGKTTPEEKAEDPWIPQFMRRSWVRDWLCPLCSMIVLFTWWRPLVTLRLVDMAALSYILMSVALSTYWDWVTGKDNYYLHGLFVGASFAPFCWAGMHWWAVLANTIISCLLMGWLCSRTGKADLEECGRGFIATLTRAILII